MAPHLDIPIGVRAHLAHAAVEVLARSLQVRLLHVKGPALDASLAHNRGPSTDADVLVEPARVGQLHAAMVASGWREVTGFATGSAFQHAATLHHDHWGYVDVHRAFPGLAPDGFELLWQRRATVPIAHIECAVPDIDSQRLILLVHYARGGRSTDYAVAWQQAPTDQQQRVRERAVELDATVALAAAIGELDAHSADPASALWRAFQPGASRADEWRGRWRAAANPRDKWRVATQFVRLNRDHLTMELGREPSTQDVIRAWRRRVGRAASSLRSAVRRRDRGRQTRRGAKPDGGLNE